MSCRDDSISITDKTFDLTLEESLPEIADSNFLSQAQDQNEGSTVVDLGELLTDRDDVGATRSYMDSFEDRDRIRRSVECLRNCAVTLGRICGNDMLNYSRTGDSSLEEVERLADSMNKLAQSCELKLSFIQKNYKFLEGVYDTLGREYETLKKSVGAKDSELRELQLKNRQLERQLHALEKSKSQDENADPEILLRQRKEIKEYKRFIKELMERD